MLKDSLVTCHLSENGTHITILFEGRVVGQRLIDPDEHPQDRLLLERTRVSLWNLYITQSKHFWLCATNSKDQTEIIPIVSMTKPILMPGHRVRFIIEVNGGEDAI